MKLKRIRIGDILLQKGLITEAQLKLALEEQKKSRKKLGQIFVELGYIDEDTLTDVIAEQLGIERITLDKLNVTQEAKAILPENIARRYKALPIKLEGNLLHVAFADPLDISSIENISTITRKEIVPYIIKYSDLLKALEIIYGEENKLFKIAEEIEKKILSVGADEKFLESLAEDTPAITLVDSIIAKAVEDKASDIHIEPDEDILRIRYRIDGILHELLTMKKVLHPPIVSRIKIMSNMNIAEKRIPQDGRFQISYHGRNIDFRVSSLPTNNGEKVVLRILDRSEELLKLENLGFSEHSFNLYKDIISHPYGMILISGPTGSGKTTTMYATLNELNTIERNIITVEDPIEYNFKLINQVQVDETADLTFANALRSILRQDPDIIMVGEIRDRETAEIAIQASLTGHLVFSTVHTNDAVSSIVRLVDMGIENFLVSAALIGIVSQRLVRKICPNCKISYKPVYEIIKKYRLDEDTVLYRGEGCEKCKYSGYIGRTAIYEVLKIDSNIREMVNKNKSIGEIKNYALEHGFQPMFTHGLELVKKGITTLEEVLRVTAIAYE